MSEQRTPVLWMDERRGYEILPAASESRAANFESPAYWRRGPLGGGIASAAGPDVNEWTAQTHATVFTCVKILAESVAQLPFLLYQSDGDRSRNRARSHPTFPVLHSLANPECTAFEMFEFLMANLAMRGNAVAVPGRNQSGRVVELWPLRWDQIEVRRVMGELVYIWSPQGAERRTFERSEIWHIHSGSFDGVQGSSPVAMMAESVGYGLALQEYGGRFFSNNGNPSGVLQTEQTLNDEGFERLREQWNQAHSGLSNAHKTAILEQGVKWNAMSVAPNDAQFLESRKFNRSEIAGWFRIPAHLVNDLEHATFSNIEHLGIEFVKHSLMPWLRRFEQSAMRDLVTPSDLAAGLFPEFLVDGFLRGDTDSRYEAYSKGITAGWMTRNEARARENLNPIDGLDEPLEPLNMAQAGGPLPGDPMRSAKPAETRALEPDERRDIETRALTDARRRMADGFMPIYERAFERIIRAEEREVMKLAEKHFEERDALTFNDALLGLYADDGDLRSLLSRELGPGVEGLLAASFDIAADEVDGETDRSGLETFFASVLVAIVARHIGQSIKRINDVVEANPSGPSAELREMYVEQKANRSASAARRETVQQSRAASKSAWERSGVTHLKWRTIGDSCPFCQRLDGAVVSIRGSFVQEGEVFEAEGRKPMLISTGVGHPPLHRSCNCDISPA